MQPRRRAGPGATRFGAACLLAAIVALLGSLSPSAMAQDGHSIFDDGRLAFKLFTDRDGLPQNAIQAIATDQRGYLWVGTKDGAAWYNGRVWRHVRTPSNAATEVKALLPTEHGVWVATEGDGAGRWSPDGWFHATTQDGLPNDRARALARTVEAGVSPRIWIGTQGGLAVYEENEDGSVRQLQVYDASSGLPSSNVTALLVGTAPDGRPTVWAGCHTGLAWLRDGAWTTDGVPAGLAASVVTNMLETTSPTGAELWVATTTGLWHRTSYRWEQIVIDRERPDTPVWCLAKTRDAAGRTTIWAGTSKNGLARLRDGAWKEITSRQGLAPTGTWSLLATPGDGPTTTLWVGTAGYGLGRISLDSWVAFTETSGLVGQSVYSILRTGDRASRVTWIGTTDGLVRHENGRWSNPTRNLPPVNGWMRALVPTAQSGTPAMWAGTPGRLALLGESGDCLVFYPRTPNPPEEPLSINCLLETTTEDNRPVVWIGRRRGLSRLEDGQIHHEFLVPDEQSDPVNCLLETAAPDGSRTLWVGTQRGILYRERGTWHAITRADGLPAGTILDLRLVRAADGTRELWAGTSGSGAAWRALDGPDTSWRTLSTTTEPALPNDVVYRVEEDRAGRLYLCTNRGVVRLTPRGRSLRSAADFELFTFTVDDGLPSNECNTGASYVDEDGRLWVGTIEGVAVLDPSTFVDDKIQKPLLLERIALNGESLPAGAEGLGRLADLAYDENSLDVEFALLSFFREEATEYRTQLVGLEEAPSAWATVPFKSYTTLPAGAYTLRVWGRDYARNVTGPVELAFRVHPAPWLTWWAFALYALGIFAIGSASHKARVRRLEARQREVEALVVERTTNLAIEKQRTEHALARIRDLSLELAERNSELQRANEDERGRALEALASAQEAKIQAQQAQIQMLRYQMNPHFLFNTLNAIRAMVTRNPAGSKEMMTDLSDFLRYSLTTSTTELVTVGQEIEAVRNYLSIQERRFGKNLEVRYRVDPRVENAMVPGFLLQPLVENAIKYGGQTSPKPLVIQIAARYRDGAIRLWVSNTGAWVAPGTESLGDDGASIGLENVAARLRTIYGEAASLRTFERAGWVHARIAVDLRVEPEERPRRANERTTSPPSELR